MDLTFGGMIGKINAKYEGFISVSLSSNLFLVYTLSLLKGSKIAFIRIAYNYLII